jgi:hypothetical protein
LTDKDHKGRDAIAIDQLLHELAELRELDRLRNAHAPGSADHDAATLEVDLRSRRLMDRFRDLKEGRIGAGAAATRRHIAGTRPLDVRARLAGHGGSLLN